VTGNPAKLTGKAAKAANFFVITPGGLARLRFIGPANSPVKHVPRVKLKRSPTRAAISGLQRTRRSA
jgi:hypothetical protein